MVEGSVQDNNSASKLHK